MATRKDITKHAPPGKRIIPADEWDMPAGFRANGELASLREVTQPTMETMSFSLAPRSELLPEMHYADLMLARYKRKKSFLLYALGFGKITKQAAIREIKKNSALGHFLVQLEQLYLKHLIEDAVR